MQRFKHFEVTQGRAVEREKLARLIKGKCGEMLAVPTQVLREVMQHSAGGSNRVVLRVKDLPAVIDTLRGAGASFRNAMETGPAGSQIQVLDPDGNPVELFEPARKT